MKKILMTLGIVSALSVGIGAVTFASENATGNLMGGYRNNGTTAVESLMEDGKTFEESKLEVLQNNYSRVDAAIDRGVITAERGDEIKTEMKENSDACTKPGENRENHEGYGLNKGLNGKGNGNGNGNGYRSGNGGACVSNAK